MGGGLSAKLQYRFRKRAEVGKESILASIADQLEVVIGAGIDAMKENNLLATDVDDNTANELTVKVIHNLRSLMKK